jgi:phage/plasmid-like protein (TIGR03299 family)
MAHNIEIRNGVASFAENGKKERAWHGLGDDQQIFDRPMFVHEALKACHADYTVQAQPIAALSPEVMEIIQNGQNVPFSLLQDLIVADKMATMRLDHNETLGLVSDKYGIVQNEDAFKFVDLFCSGQFADRDNTPVIETCGVLGKGERVFVTAKFPEQIVIDAKRDDLVDMYMTFTTSHDGTGAVRAMVTPVRVVCNNTLQLAMSSNIGRISFRHTSNVMNRLDLLNKENAEFAAKALNVYEVYKNGLEQTFDHLKNIKLSEKELDNILAEVLLSDEYNKIYKQTGTIESDGIPTRSKNIFIGVKNAMEDGIGQELIESGTALWALNGLTTYYQNNANFKDAETKFDSIMDGNVYNKVNKAYSLLVAA